MAPRKRIVPNAYPVSTENTVENATVVSVITALVTSDDPNDPSVQAMRNDSTVNGSGTSRPETRASGPWNAVITTPTIGASARTEKKIRRP